MQTLRQACYQENPESAMCVQSLDDSRGLAIRITYRISLRSSSLWEPRHPLLKVVRHYFCRAVGGQVQASAPHQALRLQILLSIPVMYWWFIVAGPDNYMSGPSSQGWRSWIGVVMILPQVHLLSHLLVSELSFI